MTFSSNGSWRSFVLQASEPVIVAVNPPGSPARMLVAESSGSSSQCPGPGEDSITRYHGQTVYLAGCGTGQGTVELRRAADQAVLRTYTFTVSAVSKMYWTNAGSRDKIQRANLDGSNIEDLITTGLSYPVGLALDLTRRMMYWTDLTTDKIQRASLGGSDIEDLVTGLSEPRGIALDLAPGRIYWTDNGTDRIQSADLDGSNIQTLVTGLSIPTSIALE